MGAPTGLANLSQLSFGSIFERFLPAAGSPTWAIDERANLMCVSFAFVIAIVYLMLGFSCRYLPASLAWRALFVVAVVM